MLLSSTIQHSCQVRYFVVDILFFVGIGAGRGDVSQCIELASRPQVRENWRKCRHLIIDEVSMVDGFLFEKLEEVARFENNYLI